MPVIDEKKLDTLIHLFSNTFQVFYITFTSNNEEVQKMFSFCNITSQDIHNLFKGYTNVWNINFIIPKKIDDKNSYWLIRRLDSLEF